MNVTHQIETYTLQQEPVYRFRITNASGAYVEFTNVGARWITAMLPDMDGRLCNILQGSDKLADYLTDTYYMGAIIGRFANRISGASFSINGNHYQLEANDGRNTNHGGTSGFHQKLWQWELLPDGVRFMLCSPDGEGGYPGNLRVTVEYRWNEQSELSIRYHGVTDRATYLNMTNHAYFNLSGRKETIAHHRLMIPSRWMLDTTSEFIPTGREVEVTGTPFDFTTSTEIGKGLNAGHQQLRWNRGYNHCYILKKAPSEEMKAPSQEMLPAARLYDPASGRCLKVETDLPGILIYTGGYLKHPDTAICLETQYFPDTPSHADFPSCLLRPGEEYNQQTIYKFETLLS